MRVLMRLIGSLILSSLCLMPVLQARGKPIDGLPSDIVWSGDGRHLLVSTDDMLYRFSAEGWDAPPSIVPLNLYPVRSLDVRGAHVLVGSDQGIAVLDILSGERLFFAEGLRGQTAFRSETEIVTAAFSVNIAALERGEPVRTFGDYYWPASAMALSPDGRYVAAANMGEGGHLWDLETGEAVAALPDAPDFAFSPDGTGLAYTRMNGEIALLDVASRTPRWQALPYEWSAAYSIAFHPDGTLLAAAFADGFMLLCSAETGVLLDSVQAYVPGESPFIMDYGLAFSPDGTRVASGGSDRAVRIWNVEDAAIANQPEAVLRLKAG